MMRQIKKGEAAAQLRAQEAMKRHYIHSHSDNVRKIASGERQRMILRKDRDVKVGDEIVLVYNDQVTVTVTGISTSDFSPSTTVMVSLKKHEQEETGHDTTLCTTQR